MKPPTRLTAAGKKKWREIIPYLDLRSPLEVEWATQYCEQHALYLRAIQTLAKADLTKEAANGALCPNPCVKIQSGAVDQMRRLALLLRESVRDETEGKEVFDLD